MDSSVSIENLLKSISNEPADITDIHTAMSSKPVVKDKPVAPIKNDDVKQSEEKSIDKDSQKIENESIIIGSLPTKSDLTSKWPELVAAVSKMRKSIGNILEHSDIDSVKENRVAIIVNNQPKFNLGLLERNRSIIEDSLEKMFKVHLLVSFTLGEKLNDGASTPKKPLTEKKEKADPASKIIEMFDGEILR
jgi:hypothetical protein